MFREREHLPDKSDATSLGGKMNRLKTENLKCISPHQVEHQGNWAHHIKLLSRKANGGGCQNK